MSWQSNCKVCSKRGKCETEKEMEEKHKGYIAIGCSACEPKPKTNADKIRAMTDEELAEWVTTKGRTFGEEYEGYMSLLDWLKSPVEIEND